MDFIRRGGEGDDDEDDEDDERERRFLSADPNDVETGVFFSSTDDETT
jgi:hypothetical protein